MMTKNSERVFMKIRELYIVLKDANILFQNWEPVCLDDKADIEAFFKADKSRTDKDVENLVSLIVGEISDGRDIARLCKDDKGNILAVTLASTYDDAISLVFISEEVFTFMKPVLSLLKIEVK